MNSYNDENLWNWNTHGEDWIYQVYLAPVLSCLPLLLRVACAPSVTLALSFCLPLSLSLAALLFLSSVGVYACVSCGSL
jgi:hypothetical protein